MAARRGSRTKGYVTVGGHTRSPRGSDKGKSRPSVKGYRRKFPPKSSYPR